MSTEWITVKHPTTGGEAKIALSALAAHEQSGWVLVTGESDTGTIDATVSVKAKKTKREVADDGEN